MDENNKRKSMEGQRRGVLLFIVLLAHRKWSPHPPSKAGLIASTSSTLMTPPAENGLRCG